MSGNTMPFHRTTQPLAITVAAILLAASTVRAQSASTSPSTAPAPPTTPDPARLSALWGADGGAWTPISRLPDFSHAGYRGGDTPIPTFDHVVDATTLGVKADGVTDDAPALQRALDATKSGLVLLPPGRILLGSVVTLRHSNLVLRGAGRDKTTFVIPRPLQQIDPRPNGAGNKAVYSFSGGFILFRGSDHGVKLADLAAASPRGCTTITIAPPPATTGHLPAIAPGLRVRLVSNVDPALGRLILGGQNPGEATPGEMKHYLDTVATVVAVDGRTVTLDRPLRLGAGPQWQVELWSFAPTVEEAGLEDVAFEFPGKPKKPHLLEEGFNAVFMFDVANCWVRGVDIIDCDNGVNLRLARSCTIADVRLLARKRAIPTGHHALWASGRSQDCLFTRFDIQTQFIHDLTVEGLAHGNVFMDGRGESLNFDHHRNAPYENLFTNLDVGDVGRLWESSGSFERGPHSGVRETFWNIRSSSGKPPGLPGFPQANLVGVQGYRKAIPADPASAALWVEAIKAGAGVWPANLYEAQREGRATSGRGNSP
ncbi:MAG: glycosyl hydrolase family 28-related protein [Planctomycetota bacterium]|nr:glycosyl hydrolase family 28-related protein [Planctomycetota bacterium]